MQAQADLSKQIFYPPFTIAIDTREQMPFHFVGMAAKKSQGGGTIVVKTENVYLPSGDYSIVGREAKFAIERKSKADLFSSVGKQRERFEAEVQRLDQLDWAAVVVECDLYSIMNLSVFSSEMRPESVQATILAWSIRYPGVHWFPCSHRRHAEKVTYSLLEFCSKIFKTDAPAVLPGQNSFDWIEENRDAKSQSC